MHHRKYFLKAFLFVMLTVFCLCSGLSGSAAFSDHIQSLLLRCIHSLWVFPVLGPGFRFPEVCTLFHVQNLKHLKLRFLVLFPRLFSSSSSLINNVDQNHLHVVSHSFSQLDAHMYSWSDVPWTQHGARCKCEVKAAEQTSVTCCSRVASPLY